MTAVDLAAKYGLDENWIEKSAQEYEDGTYESSDAPVHVGTHLDAVGTKRVTVIYNSEDVMTVNHIAKTRGVKSSEIYRAAVRKYLDEQNLAHT